MLKCVVNNINPPAAHYMKLVTIAALTEYYRTKDKLWHDKFSASLRRYDGQGCPVTQELYDKIQAADMSDVLEKCL